MTPEEKAKERLLKFQQAKKKAEEEKASHSNFAKEDVPEFKTCVLNKEKPKIIRLMGNSPLMREKPTDPIVVKKSMCVDDEGHWATIILSDDRNHPINVLFRTIIGKYKYDKETRTRTYDNVGKPSFERFMRNGKPKEKCTAMEHGMQPDTFYLFNCIDKTDDWCKENKHTKLLCWDSSSKEVDGEMRTYYTYGVKPSFYNEVFDIKCTELNRMYDQFDVVAMRLKEKKGESYLTILTPEQKTAIENLGLDSKKVTMDYLTDEEENYEMYKLEDIPFISRPTSVSYYLKVFSKLIKQADMDFNNGDPILYNMFVEAKEKELEEIKKRNAEKSENSNEIVESETDDSESEENEVEETVDESSEDELPSEVEEQTPPPTATKKVVKSAKFDPLALKSVFPYIDKLTEDELKQIIGYDKESGKLAFDSTHDVCECPCGAELPENYTSCYKCGAIFEE